MQIVVRQPSGPELVPIAQYLLKDVVITDINVSGAGKVPDEVIQGKYAAIQFATYQTGPNGSTKPGSSVGWDPVTNKQIRGGG